jgi:hypothetical protein
MARLGSGKKEIIMAQDKQIPAPTLYQLAASHYVSHALALIAKLEIADRLADGPRSSEELARTTQTDASSLRRVLRLLASVGVFEEDEQGRFHHNGLSEPLRGDVPGSMKAMVTVFAGEGMQKAWQELEYCVRTGQPAFKKNDPQAHAFTLMSKDPQYAATFDEAMATFAPQTAAAITAAYDFSRFGSLIDVGGGNGTLLKGILQANPKLRGVLFDQPHVIERTRASEPSSGLELVGGSFFEQVPSGHDAYLLKHVIHDWNDADAVRILKVCRKAMPASGTLLIAEGVYPARITPSPEVHGAAANDVNMLVNTGGRQRSEAEFRAILSGASFELTRIVPTQARVCLIEGAPR